MVSSKERRRRGSSTSVRRWLKCCRATLHLHRCLFSFAKVD
jgi:hypothetical protein